MQRIGKFFKVFMNVYFNEHKKKLEDILQTDTDRKPYSIYFLDVGARVYKKIANISSSFNNNKNIEIYQLCNEKILERNGGLKNRIYHVDQSNL